MALTPGSRLAHRQAQGDLEQGRKVGVYDITTQIGEGGMGQVWRATDSTLGRQVAIKILPDAFAADPERLAKIAQLSAVNSENAGVRQLLPPVREGLKLLP